MAERVILHVGAPKTGTSLIQSYMFANPDALAARGILYPGDRFDAHFLAALDLMRLRWGGLELEATGAWDRLAERVREWQGTAIISHEILARATPEMVTRAFDSLGDAEVHVLVSARDLVRQIPAEYQENVKHRRVLSYADFLTQIRDPARDGTVSSWFWDVQSVPEVLERWGAPVAPAQVHVVTVPPSGADPGILLDRFAEALSLNARSVRAHRLRVNPSLGSAETAFLRRVNSIVNHGNRVPGRFYRQYVRELLAHQTLAVHSDAPRIGLPAETFEWAREVSASWAEELGRRGYQIIGDLSDLVVSADARPDSAFPDPDHPDEAAVSSAGVEATAALVGELVQLHREYERLQERLERPEDADTIVQRLKRRVLEAERTNVAVRQVMRVVRRVRGH